MPSLPKRRNNFGIPKPDPKKFYECLESHVSDLGIFREGDRLRGDHEDVLANRMWWVEEGLDTEQRHAERQRRMKLAYPPTDSEGRAEPPQPAEAPSASRVSLANRVGVAWLSENSNLTPGEQALADAAEIVRD
jgi:hypothetical protein